MRIEAAEVVIPCSDIEQTVPFFTDRLGFKILSIFPADDPAIVVLAGHGVRLQLSRLADGDPGTLRLLCNDAIDETELTAPNGTRVTLVVADPPVAEPTVEHSLVVQKAGGQKAGGQEASDESGWGVGRAGMLYRDLVPGRQGGSIIASHIRIPGGGPVPDYVHFHKIRFQMLYCYKGWVRLVYQDQGAPFLLGAGDCVLQPPEIRHRVLESSPGLEVIEVGCPAEHMTCVDHDLTLPTPTVETERRFGGQRFVRHQAATADWRPWRRPGFEARDIGIAAATNGLADVKVARLSGPPEPGMRRHDAELLFMFVLQGTVTLRADGHDDQRLAAGDSFIVPPELPHDLTDCGDGLELLEVALPAAFDLH